MNGEIERIINELNKRNSSVRINKLLNYLNQRVESDGLHHTQVVPVIKLALLSELNESQTKLALKCLIARTHVPSEAIIIAISQLNDNRQPKQIQINIVEWILKIFNDIDDTGPVHCLYDILFYYLEDDNLSFYVVQILSKLTLKNDVKRYRINKLMQLCHKSGAPSHLSILLHTFRTLNPVEVEKVFQTQPFTREHRSVSLKRKKENRVNEPKTGNSDTLKNQLMPMPFYGFDLLNTRSNIHIGLPCSPLKLLQNPKNLFYLCIQNESDIPLRLDMWLRFYLTNCLTNELDYKGFSGILIDLFNFQDYIQEGLPAVTIFLKRFLKTSNFKHFLFPTLDLITNIQICPMNELYDNFIEPLVKFCFTTGSEKEVVLIIYSFKQMLQNFAFTEMNKRKSTYRSIFKTNQNINNESLKTLVKFISCMNEFILEIIIETSSFTVLYSILSFYQLLPDLHLKYNLPIIELPPKQIIEMCLLSNNAFPIIQLCALMSRYKFAFKSLKQLKPGAESAKEILNRSLDHIKTFNCYLLLICDILFRNRAFMSENVSFYLTFETLDHIPIAYKHEKFSLCNHPAFIEHIFQFLKATIGDSKIEDMHSFFIKPQSKELNFKFLETCNLNAIGDFFNEFVSKKNIQKDDSNE